MKSFNNVTVVRDEDQLPAEPLVSVCIVTYNQEDYIAEALDSVLAQTVDFPFEIIVGDDYSTDQTRNILRQYQRAYPSHIVLNLHDEHYDGIPARKNMVVNLRAARGTYVALLDGDDFWISRDKLRKQTEVLEAHPELAFSFHDAVSVWPERQRAKYPTLDQQALRTFNAESLQMEALMQEAERYPLHRFSAVYSNPLQESRRFTPDEIVYWHFKGRHFAIPAGSVMFRRSLFVPIPEWFGRVWNADKAMQLHFSTSGGAYYHKDLLLYYRRGNPTSMVSRFRYSAHRNDYHISQVDVYCEIVPAYAKYRHYELYSRHRARTRIELEKERYGQALIHFVKGGTYYLLSLLPPAP